MSKRTDPQPGDKMIHTRLTGELHKRLRVRAAELDTTVQQWVVETIEKELSRQERRRK